MYTCMAYTHASVHECFWCMCVCMYKNTVQNIKSYHKAFPVLSLLMHSFAFSCMYCMKYMHRHIHTHTMKDYICTSIVGTQMNICVCVFVNSYAHILGNFSECLCLLVYKYF